MVFCKIAVDPSEIIVTIQSKNSINALFFSAPATVGALKKINALTARHSREISAFGNKIWFENRILDWEAINAEIQTRLKHF